MEDIPTLSEVKVAVELAITQVKGTQSSFQLISWDQFLQNVCGVV